MEDKVVELVGGGSDINRATSSSLKAWNGIIYNDHIPKKLADPSRCNSTRRQNPTIQQNRRNF